MTDIVMWLTGPVKPRSRGIWSFSMQLASLAYQEMEREVTNKKPGLVFKSFCFLLVLLACPFVIIYHEYKEFVWFLAFFRDGRRDYRSMLQLQQHLWSSDRSRRRNVRRVHSRLILKFATYMVSSFFKLYWQALQRLPSMFRQPEQLSLPI
jgi:hypothetical protein